MTTVTGGVLFVLIGVAAILSRNKVRITPWIRFWAKFHLAYEDVAYYRRVHVLAGLMLIGMGVAMIVGGALG